MNNGNGNYQQHLNEDLDAQRAHLDATIHELENRLSPGQLFDQVMGYVRANGGGFSHNLVSTVRDNPMPTLLTALGVAWMMYGQNRSGASHEADTGERFGERFDEYETPYYDEDVIGGYGGAAYGANAGADSGSGFATRDSSSAASTQEGSGKKEQLKEGAANLKNDLKEKFSDGSNRLRDGSHKNSQRLRSANQHMRRGAHNASHRARSQADHLQATFTELLHEQPLAVGAAGIALGALLGASLPRSRKEDEMFGEQSDKAKASAAARGEELYDKGKRKGAEAKDQLPEQASKADLSGKKSNAQNANAQNKPAQNANPQSTNEQTSPGFTPQTR